MACGDSAGKSGGRADGAWERTVERVRGDWGLRHGAGDAAA